MTYVLQIAWCFTRVAVSALAGAVVVTMLVRVVWDSWHSR
jgi:hypothetical protein